MSRVKLIWATPSAEKVIAYCARVSNPANQENEKIDKLLKYCIANRHWSIFEMANLTVEIETSRAISAQIIRHRSFHFQEFSLRYANAIGFQPVKYRMQDKKNRQNSLDDVPDTLKTYYDAITKELFDRTEKIYMAMLNDGIAKETARMILPLATTTRLYMQGTVRDWIHYINLRTDPTTQREHQEIALMIKAIFMEEFPIISKALEWV